MGDRFLSARGKVVGLDERVLRVGWTKTCERSFDKLRMNI